MDEITPLLLGAPAGLLVERAHARVARGLRRRLHGRPHAWLAAVGGRCSVTRILTVRRGWCSVRRSSSGHWLLLRIFLYAIKVQEVAALLLRAAAAGAEVVAHAPRRFAIGGEGVEEITPEVKNKCLFSGSE